MSKLKQEDIYAILHEALLQTNTIEVPENAFGPSLKLLGGGGLLDSLSCMLFLVNVDRLISEKTGLTMEMVGDFDFTRLANPFRDVGSLAEFIDASLYHGGHSEKT